MQINLGSKLRPALVACGFGLLLAACAAEQPQSTVSRNLDSGVTSSNGGGMQPGNFSGTTTRVVPR